jgi:hypothetical protein
MTIAKEITKYKLHLVRVQEVIWDRDGIEPTGEYTVFCGKVYENHELGTGFFVYKRVKPTVKSAEFVSDWILCIVLRGHWCYIIALHVHAPTEDKICVMKIGSVKN